MRLPASSGKARWRNASTGSGQGLTTGNGNWRCGRHRRGRAVVLFFDGLPTRASTCQTGPRQLQLQIPFGACPECHRPRFALRARSRQSNYGLVQAAAGRSRPCFQSQYLLKLINLARFAKDRPQDAVRGCPTPSNTCWYTAHPRTRPRAPAFTEFLRFCATALKRRSSDSYRESMMSYMSASPARSARQTPAPGSRWL